MKTTSKKKSAVVLSLDQLENYRARVVMLDQWSAQMEMVVVGCLHISALTWRRVRGLEHLDSYMKCHYVDEGDLSSP